MHRKKVNNVRLSIYKSRYYEVKLDENLIVNIEPPKRKQLKKVLTLTKSMNGKNLNESDIDNIYDASLIAFFEGYYNWVMENVNQKNQILLIILEKRFVRKIHILLKQQKRKLYQSI